FLIRMGYVFFVLVILFVSLSLLSKNTVPAKPLDEHTIKTQLKWSSILFASSIICYVLGIIVMFCKASWCLTLQNLGFEGIFFLATMFLVLSIYLKSNAKDKVQDPKAIEIDLSLFRTNTQFNIGAFGIIVLLAILYITLW
ncbi:MAG TPA: hypothetical protein PK938_04045, partial [Bacteroidaceae bacterium]|nr:hypothetical protein [Bacteroidaceae bacterium]